MSHRVMSVVSSAVVAAAAFSSSAEATTFWANYQPSLNTRTAFNDVWPGFYTALDAASQTTISTANPEKFVGVTGTGAGNNPFVARNVWTEFTVNSTFTATHITFPARYSYGLDSLFGVGISSFNPANNETLSYSSSRVRPRGFSGMGLIDLTIPFGDNATGSSQWFTQHSITFQPGLIYTLVMTGNGSGGVGGFTIGDSFVSGASTNTQSNYSNSLEFQPAFALNDGINTVIPAPGAAALAMLAGAAGLRRRRNG